MKRLVTLINQLASVSCTTAALQAQADNANQAAKKYMEDNELLKQVGLTRKLSRWSTGLGGVSVNVLVNANLDFCPFMHIRL